MKAAKVDDDYPRELLEKNERCNTPQQRELDNYKEFVDKVKALIAG